MRGEAWVPLVATLVALEFTFALVRRYWASRRPYLRSWALSFAFFTLGCGALWYGTAFGWSTSTFRLYYAGGALLAVPWLAMGELELLMRPIPARILAFFLLVLSVNGLLVTFAIPLVDGHPAFGTALPHGKDFLPVPLRVILVITNALGTLVVVGGTLWSGRSASRSQDPAAKARFRGLLLIVLGVIISATSGALTFLGEAASVATTLALGAAVMFAGFLMVSRRPRPVATSAEA